MCVSRFYFTRSLASDNRILAISEPSYFRKASSLAQDDNAIIPGAEQFCLCDVFAGNKRRAYPTRVFRSRAAQLRSSGSHERGIKLRDTRNYAPTSTCSDHAGARTRALRRGSTTATRLFRQVFQQQQHSQSGGARSDCRTTRMRAKRTRLFGCALTCVPLGALDHESQSEP